MIRAAVGKTHRAGDGRIYFDDAISSKFTGHAHCDENGPQWTNGIAGHQFALFPGGDPGSFHPNAPGQRAYTNLLYGYLCFKHFLGVRRTCSAPRR